MTTHYLRLICCALLMLLVTQRGNAQSHNNVPHALRQFLELPELQHSTVAFEMVRLPQRAPHEEPDAEHPAVGHGRVVYAYDAGRLMKPASVLKLVTAATGFRLLGSSYVWPDTLAIIDTAAVALPGLECYNPDWLIEDIDSDWMPPLDNHLPDSGRLYIEVLGETLHQSLNLQAETALHLLTPSARRDSALLAVSQYWAARGLDTEGSLVMYDGSGLSPSDRVTAHFICSLLADMQFDADFRASIATVGRNGTVRNFLRGTRLAGRAQLKTGTHKNALAYAGYATGSDGRTYALCLLTADSGCKHAVLRKHIEKLLLSLIP